MSITNCRGDKAKLDIVSNYDIKPVVYVRLLSGQKINGCCGPITDKYYLFEAENKQTKDIDTFCVGYDCGDQLLQLINKSFFSCLTPFKLNMEVKEVGMEVKHNSYIH